jgi:hypothetical protein
MFCVSTEYYRFTFVEWHASVYNQIDWMQWCDVRQKETQNFAPNMLFSQSRYYSFNTKSMHITAAKMSTRSG